MTHKANANPWLAMPLLPVSWGEVFDKWTILAIKLEKLSDEQKKVNVLKEKTEIEAVIGDLSRFPDGLTELIDQLQSQNARLWDVEDGKRDHERRKDFGESFIALAREVYQGNDHRAKIKRQINNLLGSAIVEEKSHQAY